MTATHMITKEAHKIDLHFYSNCHDLIAVMFQTEFTTIFDEV